MKNLLIFIGGIHGVGKSYLSDAISQELSIPCFSASTLIREEKNRPTDTNKHVLDAGENQDHLISALTPIKENHRQLILDGHFVLKSPTDYFYVPLSTFKGISPSIIVIKTCLPETIKDRRLKRDGINQDENEIAEFQRLELERARVISEDLRIPLFELNNDNYNDLLFFIKNTVNS